MSHVDLALNEHEEVMCSPWCRFGVPLSFLMLDVQAHHKKTRSDAVMMWRFTACFMADTVDVTMPFSNTVLY